MHWNALGTGPLIYIDGCSEMYCFTGSWHPWSKLELSTLLKGKSTDISPWQLGVSNQRHFSYWPNALTARLPAILCALHTHSLWEADLTYQNKLCVSGERLLERSIMVCERHNRMTSWQRKREDFPQGKGGQKDLSSFHPSIHFPHSVNHSTLLLIYSAITCSH